MLSNHHVDVQYLSLIKQPPYSPQFDSHNQQQHLYRFPHLRDFTDTYDLQPYIIFSKILVTKIYFQELIKRKLRKLGQHLCNVNFHCQFQTFIILIFFFRTTCFPHRFANKTFFHSIFKHVIDTKCYEMFSLLIWKYLSVVMPAFVVNKLEILITVTVTTTMIILNFTDDCATVGRWHWMRSSSTCDGKFNNTATLRLMVLALKCCGF